MSFGYHATCTYWTAESVGGTPGDPFDPPSTQWVRNTAKCEWTTSNETRKDDTGAEFVPRSLFYTPVNIPKGAKIVFGDISGTEPPLNAETVRAVDSGTGFAGDALEYLVITA